MSSVLNRWGRIDVLVNNAGIIQVGPMECMQRADFEHAIAMHLWGPINMVDVVLPSMRRQGEGRIVNIASIGAHLAVPQLLPYAASKFALRGWSEGLAAELRKDGIYVTTVCPGLMRTGSAGNADFKGRHRQEYAMFAIGAATPVLAIHSRTAARRIVEACRRGAPVAMVSGMSAIAAGIHGMCARVTIPLLGLIGNYLPNAAGGTRRSVKGWDSEPNWMPSPITAMNDTAAVWNNEV